MNRLLAPGYVHTDDRGNFQPRSTWLKVMHRRAAGLRNLKITMKDIRIRMLGSAALVTGKEFLRPVKPNGTPGEPLRFTQVWTHGTSGWQRLAFQATPIFSHIKLDHVTCGKTDPTGCTASGTFTITVPAGGGTQHQPSSCTFVPGPRMSAQK